MTPDYFCSEIVKVCKSRYEAISLEDDIAKIMSDKPASSDFAIDKLYEMIAADQNKRETVTFIQFADTHMDYKYKEGATADCRLIYCCREESETGFGTIKAGKFGARGYGCDVPKETVESALD